MMKEYNYQNVADELLVDIRDNKAFRMGHLKNSLNVTPKQFPKYGNSLIDSNRPVVAVVENEADLNTIENLAFSGYILFDKINQTDLVTSDTISAMDFLNLSGDYTLLDLRHPNEITRPAPGENLVNIPLEDLADNLNQLDKESDIYLLCGSGARATAGAAYLERQGFTQANVIEGGIKSVNEAQNK